MGAFIPDDPEIDLFGYDLAWPLALDGNGDLAVVSGEDNALSALPIRAITRRGEVPIFPNDGLDTEDFENGLVTDEERAVLQARLLEQYRREDRLTSVTVTPIDGDVPEETVVRIEAELRSGRTAPVDVAFGGG